MSQYIFDFIKKARCGMQQSEKGEKIAIAIKMPIKCIFPLYFITSIYDRLLAECMKRFTI